MCDRCQELRNELYEIKKSIYQWHHHTYHTASVCQAGNPSYLHPYNSQYQVMIYTPKEATAILSSLEHLKRKLKEDNYFNITEHLPKQN